MSNPPVLYSFRRCPYAIRARLAICLSGIEVELREVILKNKPPSMLQASPKGTVPVLVMGSQVIDESLDIMRWAAENGNAPAWPDDASDLQQLIKQNDNEFKHWLDRYKYHERFPEQHPEYYRQQACRFIAELETRLGKQPYLSGEESAFTDLAIWPFIRQFAFCDIKWFEDSAFPNTQRWLQEFLESDLFRRIMGKYPAWKEGEHGVIFPE